MPRAVLVDVVGLGVPLGPELLVARGACGNGGHGGARQIAVGVPASEDEARAGGCGQGDVWALDGVFLVVAGGHGATVLVVVDGIDDGSELSLGGGRQRLAADGRNFAVSERAGVDVAAAVLHALAVGHLHGAGLSRTDIVTERLDIVAVGGAGEVVGHGVSPCRVIYLAFDGDVAAVQVDVLTVVDVSVNLRRAAVEVDGVSGISMDGLIAASLAVGHGQLAAVQGEKARAVEIESTKICIVVQDGDVAAVDGQPRVGAAVDIEAVAVTTGIERHRTAGDVQMAA